MVQPSLLVDPDEDNFDYGENTLYNPPPQTSKMIQNAREMIENMREMFKDDEVQVRDRHSI